MVHLVRGAAEVNAKSVVAILGFEVKEGDALQIKATGQDALKAAETLAKLLDEGCGDSPGQAPAAAPSVPSAPRGNPRGENELAGLAASPGLAMGRAFQYRLKVMEVIEAGGDPAQETVHLEAALHDASLQIEAIKARVRAGVDLTRVGILSAHQELLVDPEHRELACAGIKAGKSAAFAWRAAYSGVAATLAGLESPLLRERANDIRDVGRRALALLTGSVQTRMEAPADSILIADELSPSEAAQLDRTRVLGLCTTTGGPTGHVAILARALGIPAVCGIDPAALELPDQTLVLLDGGTGILRRIPTEAGQAEARELVGRQAAQRAEESAAAQKPAVTRDGVAIEVAANIRNAQEAREAVAAGAQGVGLLRSEFLFLDRETAPTEDEQAAEYGAVARILGLGVDELSVSVPAIGAIKALISRLDRAQCQTLAHELLQMRTAAEVRERLAVVAE